MIRHTRDTGPRGRTAVVAVPVTAGLLGVTALLAAVGPESVVRHAYLIPVVAAALWGGFGMGLFVGAGAGLLYAPFVLPGIEGVGLTAAAREGLATLALLPMAGAIAGALAGAAARERDRCRVLLALQRLVADEGAVDTVLERLGTELGRRLGADVALVVKGPDGTHVAGAPDLLATSAVAATLASGTVVFVPDLGGTPRPRRLVAVPITVREGAIGALAVARFGELTASERLSVAALGAAVGPVLENARLLARQRRFADELEATAASARRELETINRTKSLLVATASHELRTPLTSLRGFSELLIRRTHPPEQVRRYAGIIHHESERLSRLVDDLLDLSRLERGVSPPVRRTVVEVRAALAAAIEFCAGDSRGHELELDGATDLPAVDADPDALDRIVKNLLTNAMKYSPPSPIVVTARRLGAAVEIAIQDRGRGIPPEALPRLFEPYFRVPETADLAPGTGIGLAVVKALVEAHGGTVSVESALGCGTRVAFTLPVAIDFAASAASVS